MFVMLGAAVGSSEEIHGEGNRGSRSLVLSHISICPCRNLHPKPRSVRRAAEEITAPLTQNAIVEIKDEQHVLLALTVGEQERTRKRDRVHQLCGCYWH